MAAELVLTTGDTKAVVDVGLDGGARTFVKAAARVLLEDFRSDTATVSVGITE